MAPEKKSPDSIIGSGSRSSVSGRAGNIQPNAKGTGLVGQEKKPKDLREETFLAPDEQPTEPKVETTKEE